MISMSNIGMSLFVTLEIIGKTTPHEYDIKIRFKVKNSHDQWNTEVRLTLKLSSRIDLCSAVPVIISGQHSTSYGF